MTRFLSTDELASKYPNISPYDGFNNNPNIYNDADGKDWGITTATDKNGNETVTLKLTAAVLNASSNSKLNMKDFAAAMKNQVQTSYSIKYTKTIYEPVTMPNGLDRESKTIWVPKDVEVTVNVQVDVRVISKESDLESDEHLVKVMDSKDLPGIYGKANKIGGKEVDIGDKYVPNIINGNDNNTLVHELGHTFGLRHIDAQAETFYEKLFSSNPQYMNPSEQAKNSTNAMFSGGSSYMKDKTSIKIIGKQIEYGRKAYSNGELNKK